MVKLLIGRILKPSDEVDLIHLVKTLAHGRLLLVLEKRMDGNRASLPRQVFALVVGHPLVIVVETHIFGGQHLEATHLDAVLLGQVDEIPSVLFLGVGVVDHHALALPQRLVCHFVALLFGFQGVAVDPDVLGEVVDAES